MNRFAGQIDLTDYLDGSPDWSQTVSAADDAAQSKELNNLSEETDTLNSGIANIAKIRAAKHGQDATNAVAAAKASAKVQGAFADTLGGVFKSGITAYGKANNLGVYGD